MRHYKKEWLEKKFQKVDPKSSQIWKVISEVRDLNDTKGRSIPDLIDPDQKMLERLLLRQRLNTLMNISIGLTTVFRNVFITAGIWMMFW